MYIYFDVNGNLREIIYNPVRKGSYNDNEIFIYVESQSGGLEQDGIFKLPTAYTAAKISFDDLDTGNSLNGNDGTPLPMTKLSGDNAIQIPYDSKRDLKYFKYGHKYEVWSITLPDAVTNQSGVVVTTAYLYNTTAQKALNTFTFNVESSVGIALGSTMSESQYSYLYNRLQSYMTLQVPYTGATNNVDLGSYYLTAAYIEANSSNRNKATFRGATGEGLIPYIKMYDETDTKAAYLGVDSDGEFVIAQNNSDWSKVATQEWVDTNFFENYSDEELHIGNTVFLYNGESQNLEYIQIGPSDWSLQIYRNKIVKEVDGVDNTYNFDATDSGGTFTLATQEWVKSKHNGIYEVSDSFFPTDGTSHTITVDVDLLEDIAKNANTLINTISQGSEYTKERHRITFCETTYNSSNILTYLEMVYGIDYPMNDATSHYVYYKQARKLVYNRSNNTITVKTIINVDNS